MEASVHGRPVRAGTNPSRSGRWSSRRPTAGTASRARARDRPDRPAATAYDRRHVSRPRPAPRSSPACSRCSRCGGCGSAGWPARWLFAAWLVYALGIFLVSASPARPLPAADPRARVRGAVRGRSGAPDPGPGRTPAGGARGHRRHPEAGAGAAGPPRMTTTRTTTRRDDAGRETPADRAGRAARRRRVRRGRRAGDGRAGRGRRGGACRGRRRGSAPGRPSCRPPPHVIGRTLAVATRAARVRGGRRASRPHRRGRRCERP